MSTPQFLTYVEAAEKYNTTARHLRRLTANGVLTRYKSHRNRSFTLLSTTELDQTLNTVHPAA